MILFGLALQGKAGSVPDRLAHALEIASEELVTLRETLRRVTATALEQSARTEN